MRKIMTKSGAETKSVAKEFAKTIVQPVVITLAGNLGVGKTTFAQGFAEGLGITERIISPTFIIMKQYPLSPNYRKLKLEHLYHVDLYRVNSNDTMLGVSLREIIQENKSIILIEWPGKMEKQLPEKRINIIFDYVDDDIRNISIE